MIKDISCLLFLWNLSGLAIWIYIICHIEGPHQNTTHAEFINPVWIYKNYKVNYFGAIVVSIGYSIICPMVTIYHWIYKLMTIGRK